MAGSITSAGFADTKRHYEILDGLRGVAALMVVAFHLLEAHAASRFVQIINHGYMAVDFFFLLSGFVIGYAYDDRWSRMTTADFFKRRLIRLHPMIIMATMIGALMLYFQEGELFPKVQETSVWLLLAVTIIGMALIPAGASLDVRGFAEMYPLNGPAWSLFYEYVGNILYALIFRKFTKLMLGGCVLISGCALVHYCVMWPAGDVIGGWSLNPVQIRIALVRLLYPFFAGLLLSRVVKVRYIKHAFPLSSLLVVVALSLPRFGGDHDTWINGIYESICIIFVFPLVVYLGASGKMTSGPVSRFCRFLGEISYPIYIIHYPFVYAYTAWVASHRVTLMAALPVTVMTLLCCFALAYFCLRFYDIPIRRWLTSRYMQSGNNSVLNETNFRNVSH